MAGATGYLVDEWINGAWKQIGSLGSGSTGCTVTGLSPNTTYYFDVAAYNAAGTTWANSQSATTFQNTVVVDHPAADTAYSPVSGSLFGANGPSYLDVQQGALGDCWLLASLAEVAARDPSDIRNMFTYDGTTMENGSVVGLYTVRFFDNAGAPEYVTVDTELPSGGGYYDQPVNGVLWVALAEKAYAEANGAGIRHHPASGQRLLRRPERRRPVLGACKPSPGSRRAITALTPPTSPPPGTRVSSSCSATSNAVPVPTSSATTPTPSSATTRRAASRLRCTTRGGPTLRGGPRATPAQIYGLFSASASFLSQNFAEQTIGTGTAAGLDDHGNSLQVGAGSANSGSAISASTR